MKDEADLAAVVLVAAPASSQGKTTIAGALARLHTRQGSKVQCFKYGSDFIDPLWLRLACEQPVDSLDLWINGEEDCARRLFAAAQSCDLVIIEGVMGLYDGDPSAADLAHRFNLPILAVIDASAMAETFAAIAHGLCTWRKDLRWAGVFANRVGSERHAAMLENSLATKTGNAVVWQGSLIADTQLIRKERHLGLSLPHESDHALAQIDLAADALANTPLGERSLSQWPKFISTAVTRRDQTSIPAYLDGQRIALAHDAAFAFVYPANVAVLQEMGAQVLPFSPLAGDELPECDALWLPGGYPERHLAELASCTKLQQQIRQHALADKPIWAECGGMLALSDSFIDSDGHSHPLWGVLPGETTPGHHLAAIGPHRLQVEQHELRGHSFHFCRFESVLQPICQTKPAHHEKSQGEPVFQLGSVRASWFHPWFASSPMLAADLFSIEPRLAWPTGAFT